MCSYFPISIRLLLLLFYSPSFISSLYPYILTFQLKVNYSLLCFIEWLNISDYVCGRVASLALMDGDGRSIGRDIGNEGGRYNEMGEIWG